MKKIRISKNLNIQKQIPINKAAKKNKNINNNPIKITNYITPHTSDITSKENPDFYTGFVKLKKEIESNISLELNNIIVPKSLTNSIITSMNTYKEEIYNNIYKNINSNKLKEFINNKFDNILNFIKNQFKIIEVSRKNAINKLNIGFERLNEFVSNNYNLNQNPNIKLIQSENFIEIINSLSKLIKNFMTNESLLTKQLEENYSQKNLFNNLINQLENNGLNFFSEAKNIFQKLRDLQSQISNNLKEKKEEMKTKSITNKIFLKPSLSLNHYSGLMKAKRNLAKNKRFLSIIGKLNNSCSNIKSNNNDFSNASIEKEYINTNPSVTNNSTSINIDSKKIILNDSTNNNINISNDESNKKNYSFLIKNLGRNSKSLEKEIINLKNSFNSQNSVSKNSEEYENLSNINNLSYILAQKISEFFIVMNNLQKSILQKRKNINELKKKFELLKKNIEYYSSLILKKNTNSNNIIIVDGEMKNERLNTNTSTEIKYEKEKIRNKLNCSNQKNEKSDSLLNKISLSKLIEYENLNKIQNEKIKKLETSNELLKEDNTKLNTQISKLNEEFFNINKIINNKIKQLNIKTEENNLCNLINFLISNEESRNFLEKENGINKYYNENIKLKKIIEECIEIIYNNIKNKASKYLNMKIPSLFNEINNEENVSIKSQENKIKINERNAKKAVNLFITYNNSLSDKMEKMEKTINDLKEINEIYKEIIKNTSEDDVDEKELIDFEKEFFK